MSRPARLKYDKNAIRNWTLYVIRKTDGHYYIGITSYKDFMRRINEHGTNKGAKVNRNKITDEVIEIQSLGKMSFGAAQQIENDVYLTYRKKYGFLKVKGGYDTQSKTTLIPTYSPGSREANLFIVSALLLGLFLLAIIMVSGL